MMGLGRMHKRIMVGIVSLVLGFMLAGCGQQPIGSFERAQFIADGGQAHHDVHFTPGCTRLAKGEGARLAAFIKEIEPGRTDDIVVRMVSTGSSRRDRERRQSLLSALDAGNARVQLTTMPAVDRGNSGENVALVQVNRHDRTRVDCKNGGYSENDLLYRMPFPVLNCANPSNLAHMAAEPRDLTRPRALGPARGEPAGSAIRRQREGEIETVPLDTTIAE